MTNGQLATERFPKERILGGRATIDYYLSHRGTAAAHPLSEKSLFIVAPGLFAGTGAPQSGRLSVGGKSPLTGGIKEANVGGTASHKFGRLGIRAILVEGTSREWKILKIDRRGAKLEGAGDIIGLTNYAACDRIRDRYGKQVGILITGPAGEMKLANSTVAVTDPEGRPSRHAARGGVGALMGAKGLKAIVVDDEGGTPRRGVNEEAFKEATKNAAEAIQNSPFRNVFHNLGTPMFVDLDNGRGSMPTNNHRLGSFEKVQKINAAKMVELNKTRGGSMGHGCMPGCVVRCSPIFHGPDGKFVTAAFEYETIVMLGANLGIDDLDAIARMDRRCDEIGLDTIEMGCTIGVLNDVGIFQFGDAAKAEALIEEIARGTMLGRVLGSGVAVTAKVFGIDRIPAVKGQGIPAHAARSSKGWAVTYATSPQGADHTAGAVLEDPLSPVGQVDRSRKQQILMAALDATGLCQFSFLPPNLIVPMINGLCGVNWSIEDYLEMGKEMLRQERAFNLKAGIGPGADRLPEWMKTEPLVPTNAVFDVPDEEMGRVFNF
jgi:aldehyde:ferredoxin oxidoreductase